MDGRVKTLHPKLYAGLLARARRRRAPAGGRRAGGRVRSTSWREPVPVRADRRPARRAEAEVIENIDIGGPTMIRAAAKNFAFSAAGRRPRDLRRRAGRAARAPAGGSRFPRASGSRPRAFAYTARYDTAIARWFGEREERFPPLLVRAYEKVIDLRYGENPHQRAAYYSEVGARACTCCRRCTQHGGKELSFNNLLDLDAARRLLDEFTMPACVIVKHNNPCGCALGEDVVDGLPPRVRVRPDERVRRHHRRQPARRSRAGRGHHRAVRRGPVRARLQRRGAGGPGREAEPARARGHRAPPPRRRAAGAQAGARRGARAGPRHRARAVRGHAGRDQARAHRGRVARSCSSPGGCASTCKLQRDRPGPGPGHGSASARGR